MQFLRINWKLHFGFVIVLLVFYVVRLLPINKLARDWDDMRRKTVPFRRRAKYLKEMFFGVYNRETRMLGLGEKYIREWTDCRMSELRIEADTRKKESNVEAVLAFLNNSISESQTVGEYLRSKDIENIDRILSEYEQLLQNSLIAINSNHHSIANNKSEITLMKKFCKSGNKERDCIFHAIPF